MEIAGILKNYGIIAAERDFQRSLSPALAQRKTGYLEAFATGKKSHESLGLLKDIESYKT